MSEQTNPMKYSREICRIMTLPHEHWISSAHKAVTINPANAVAAEALRAAVPGAVIPAEHLAGC